MVAGSVFFESRFPIPESRCDFHRRIEQLEDSFGRRHRTLQDVEFLRHVADRTEEPRCVLQGGHQRTEGQDAAEHPAASDPDDERGRERAD